MKTPGPKALEVARAATLNKKLALAQIALFEVSARHSAEEVVPTPQFSFSMNLESPSCVIRATDVVALFPLNVTVEHLAGGVRVPLAQIRVVARVFYRIADDFNEADAAAVPDYIGIVGWMHAWPYLRAEVQSLSTNLDFPPLVLPVLLSGQTADISVQVVTAPAIPKEHALLAPRVLAKARKAKAKARSPRGK